MKLLTKELKKQIPPMYTNEDIPVEEQVVVAKFFAPWSAYTLYVTEGAEEDDDYIFYGLVTGLVEDEFGYTSLSEMESVRGPYGFYIERDIHFTPAKIKDILALKNFLERRSNYE